MNPTNQPDSQAGDDMEVTIGKLQLTLRDIIANNNTGYSYEELKQAIKDGEDLLEDDELGSVDRTVNLLGHFINHYAERRATERAVAEQEQLRWLLCRKAEKNGSWTMDGLELMKASNKRTSELSARLTGEAKQ